MPTSDLSEIMRLIQSGDAVVKTIYAPAPTGGDWDGFLAQLADPEHKRPVKNADGAQLDRTKFYDPKTGRWLKRKINSERGAAKKTTYTKKTSLSLLPKDGVMTLYEPPEHRNNMVGLLFDLNNCHRKNDKYIFKTNINSHTKWWVKRKNKFWQQTERSISLSELQQYLDSHKRNRWRNPKEIPEHNELLMGVSVQALRGVFATQDNLFNRLNAQVRHKQLTKTLELELPIFIITPNLGYQSYPSIQQQRDIQAALKYPSGHQIRYLVESLGLPKTARSVSSSSLVPQQKKKSLLDLPPEVKEIIFSLLDLQRCVVLMSGIQRWIRESSSQVWRDLYGGLLFKQFARHYQQRVADSKKEDPIMRYAELSTRSSQIILGKGNEERAYISASVLLRTLTGSLEHLEVYINSYPHRLPDLFWSTKNRHFC